MSSELDVEVGLVGLSFIAVEIHLHSHKRIMRHLKLYLWGIVNVRVLCRVRATVTSVWFYIMFSR